MSHEISGGFISEDAAPFDDWLARVLRVGSRLGMPPEIEYDTNVSFPEVKKFTDEDRARVTRIFSELNIGSGEN